MSLAWQGLAYFTSLRRVNKKIWISYRHRHALGKFWRSANVTCQYPDHDGVRKRIQGRDVITLHMSQDIQKLFGGIIPVESGSPQ